MVTQESLQSYAEQSFAAFPCKLEAKRDLNNGKFLLLVGETAPHPQITLDENDINSDMERAVREFRDKLFPPPEPAPEPVVEFEVKDAASVELAAVSERQPAEPGPPASTAAPQLSPEATADAFPAEKTKPDSVLPAPKSKR